MRNDRIVKKPYKYVKANAGKKRKLAAQREADFTQQIADSMTVTKKFSMAS